MVWDWFYIGNRLQETQPNQVLRKHPYNNQYNNQHQYGYASGVIEKRHRLTHYWRASALRGHHLDARIQSAESRLNEGALGAKRRGKGSEKWEKRKENKVKGTSNASKGKLENK